jgi:hypothetical protein
MLRTSFRFPGFFVVVLLATACRLAPGPAAPTATSATAITRERAIEIATQQCWSSHLVLVGAPRNVRAQLVTLDEANQLTSSDGTLNSVNTKLESPQITGLKSPLINAGNVR